MSRILTLWSLFPTLMCLHSITVTICLTVARTTNYTAFRLGEEVSGRAFRIRAHEAINVICLVFLDRTMEQVTQVPV